MNGYPSADAILDAVARTLRNEILPLLSGAAAFNLRVSINAIELVARELTLTPAHAVAAEGMLRELLKSQGDLSELRTMMVERLREGSLSLDDERVARCLRTLAAQQLSIDQPKYSALQAMVSGE
jgi:hypothetical protein